MQDEPIETADEVITKGQEVQVRVIEVNKLKGRVSLSMRPA